MGSTHSDILTPLNTGGSLQVTRRLKHTNNALLLCPSTSQYIYYYFFIVISISSFTKAALLNTTDLFATFALILGGSITFALARVMRKKFDQYRFCKKTQCVYNDKSKIKLPFNEIDTIEVIKKIVNAKTQENPFQSGEVRLLTHTGERFLLTEGANATDIRNIAYELSQYTNAHLIFDNKLHRT